MFPWLKSTPQRYLIVCYQVISVCHVRRCLMKTACCQIGTTFRSEFTWFKVTDRSPPTTAGNISEDKREYYLSLRISRSNKNSEDFFETWNNLWMGETDFFLRVEEAKYKFSVKSFLNRSKLRWLRFRPFTPPNGKRWTTFLSNSLSLTLWTK